MILELTTESPRSGFKNGAGTAWTQGFVAITQFYRDEPSPPRTASFLESTLESPEPGFEASLTRFQWQESAQQSVNQNDLPGAQGRQGKPSEEFACPKAALARFTEPELNLEGTHFYQVAVAQERLLNRLTVDARQRARM